MRIAFVPRYTRNAASTRLRCYAIAEAIARLGLAETAVCQPESPECESADVVVMQKTVDRKAFQMAHVLGAKHFYDADDIIDHETRRYIVKFADAVTTDTEMRAQGIREWFHGPVHVIPDPIDYEDGPPKPPVQVPYDGIVWFGNYPNFASIRDTMQFYQKQGYRIGAISDLTPERANMPGLELIPWSLESFPAELRKWRRCALSHRGADQAKSENKLVAAIYQGVMPAYVCGPSYEALVRKLVGLSDAEAQAYVWETYRAEVIARRAMEVYEGI